MKTIKRILIMALVLSTLLLLSACRSEAQKHELSTNMGRSVSAFERRSGTKLEKLSNGVYEKKNVVQVMAPDKKVTSITLLKKSGKYAIFGVNRGMAKTKVDVLIKDSFGKEISKTTDSDKKSVTYLYLKDKNQLYISYNIENETVVGLSYYNTTDTDVDENAKVTGEPQDIGKIMMMVGNTKIYYNEAMVYLLTAMDNYEANYGKGIWDADILGKGDTFGKMIKDEVIKQITELKIIKAKAEELKISLTEEEQADSDSYAKKQYDSMKKEDIKRFLITQELVQQVYRDNALANKVFENRTINVDTNVSDKEAKQITVQDIYIQNYSLDSAGKKVAFSQEDKDQAYNKVKSLLKQAKKTKDFKTLAESNSESDKIEYTFGKGGAPDKFTDAFEKAAFALKTGQISNIITTDTGWHILYCVSDFNEDATIQVKEKIIDQRRNNLFIKLYGEWAKNYAVVVNEAAWNSISLAK